MTLNARKPFTMTFNINKVAINFQGNLADIGQFSTKNLDDYSIVSRRQLEKILNDSGRCLVNTIMFLCGNIPSKTFKYRLLNVLEK